MKLPTLKGYVHGAQVSAYCPWCAEWHTHGVTEELSSRRGMHRVAHCFTGSPLMQDGYLIKLFNKKELKAIKEMSDAG